MTRKTLVSIVGPTAVGKTSVAIDLARHFGTEIISADSRQVYMEMNIGTAKPSAQEQSLVKHHFVDFLKIEEDYNAGKFERDAIALLEELFLKHDVVVMCGGSGLYFAAVWEGLDKVPDANPEIRIQLNAELDEKGMEPLLAELERLDPDYYNSVDRKNRQRVIRALEVIRTTGQRFSAFRSDSEAKRNFQNVKIGLNLPREELYERINSRMDQMIAMGLFDEAENLKPFCDLNSLQTVGYREIFGYLDGEYDRAEAIRLLKRNSRRFAKRQLTWLNRYRDIHWYQPEQTEEMISLINNNLK